jgi:hypothetical protein
MTGVLAVDPTYKRGGVETPQRYDPVVELRPDISPDDVEAVVRTAVEGRRDPALVEIGGNWALQLSAGTANPGWSYPPTLEIQQFTAKTAAVVADEAVVAAARAWLRFAGKRGGPTAIAIPGSDGARADLKITVAYSSAAALDEIWAALADADPIPAAAGLQVQVSTDRDTGRGSTYASPYQPPGPVREVMSALGSLTVGYIDHERYLDVQWRTDDTLEVAVALGDSDGPPPSRSAAEDAAHAYQKVLDASGLPYLLKIVHRGVPQLEIDHRTR